MVSCNTRKLTESSMQKFKKQLLSCKNKDKQKFNFLQMKTIEEINHKILQSDKIDSSLVKH